MTKRIWVLAIAVSLMGLALMAPAGAAAKKNVKITTNIDKVVVSVNNGAVVKTGVIAGANTGFDAQVKNNGKDASNKITTGDATTDVTITNKINLTSVTVNKGCGCESGEVTISGGGGGSEGVVIVKDVDKVIVDVDNGAVVKTGVVAGANTGFNLQAGNNGGSNEITTGDAAVTIAIKNKVNDTTVIVTQP